MFGYLKYLPLFYRVAHLLPVLREILAIYRPVIKLGVQLWPKAKANVQVILNDEELPKLIRQFAEDAEILYGDAMVDTKWIQQTLNKLGVKCRVDGKYGPETEAAVMIYQQARGLKVDGYAGLATVAAMKIDLRAKR